MRAYTLSVISLVACGPVVEVNETYVAPEVLEGTVPALVDEFYRLCPTDNKPQLVTLVPRMPDDASVISAARCTTTDKGKGMVFIRTDTFLSYTNEQRKWLVFHELLHCSFGQKHSEQGIMRPTLGSITEAYQIDFAAEVTKYRNP